MASRFWLKLATLHRRWVYASVAFAVILPFVWIVKLPITITPESRQLYDTVEALPDGSLVFLTFDYYASALPETEPSSRAALRHLWRKNCKILTMTTIPLGGPAIAERVTRDIAKELDKEYGVDYVNLGYQPNFTAVLKGMGGSIKTIYPADNSGTPLEELPMLNDLLTSGDGVANYNDFAFIFVVSDNAIVEDWIGIVNAQYGTPVTAATTAVSAPTYYAYVTSGQLQGLLGGMKGAAEYELLVGHPEAAVKGMSAQSMVHFLIILLVILGNAGYFINKRKNEAVGL